MSIIVTYKLIDSSELEKEFFALSAVADWVTGIGQDMFEYIEITNEQDGVIDNMQTLYDMVATIEYNHDLSQCSPACNCMYCKLSHDLVINEELAKCSPALKDMKWAVSKSSSEALRASASLSGTSVPSTIESPQIERFSDLPDGTQFYLAQTYAYGGRSVFIKTLEDGGEHNAVWVHDSSKGFYIRAKQLVIRA